MLKILIIFVLFKNFQDATIAMNCDKEIVESISNDEGTSIDDSPLGTINKSMKCLKR